MIEEENRKESDKTSVNRSMVCSVSSVQQATGGDPFPAGSPGASAWLARQVFISNPKTVPAALTMTNQRCMWPCITLFD